MPVDCCLRLSLLVPLRIVALCSLTGFLLSEFVSYRGIATKSQSIIMGSRLVDQNTAELIPQCLWIAALD